MFIKRWWNSCKFLSKFLSNEPLHKNGLTFKYIAGRQRILRNYLCKGGGGGREKVQSSVCLTCKTVASSGRRADGFWSLFFGFPSPRLRSPPLTFTPPLPPPRLLLWPSSALGWVEPASSKLPHILRASCLFIAYVCGKISITPLDRRGGKIAQRRRRTKKAYNEEVL